MNERRATQMAVAFITKANRPVGWLRLVKLMYLAEREAMCRFLLPIIGDQIFAMQQGMALSDTARLAQGKEEADGEWDQHIVRTARGLGIRRGVSAGSLGDLSEDDLGAIQRVWERYGDKSQDELVHDVHHKLPEWMDHWDNHDRKTHAVPVPYETLYRTICEGVNEADARYLAEDYGAAQERWITSNPKILGGTPVVAGTRVSVYAIRGRLTGGETPEDLAQDYPHIDRRAFRAASMFAKTQSTISKTAETLWP